jgi:hypothetical protein
MLTVTLSGHGLYWFHLRCEDPLVSIWTLFIRYISSWYINLSRCLYLHIEFYPFISVISLSPPVYQNSSLVTSSKSQVFTFVTFLLFFSFLFLFFYLFNFLPQTPVSSRYFYIFKYLWALFLLMEIVETVVENICSRNSSRTPFRSQDTRPKKEKALYKM